MEHQILRTAERLFLERGFAGTSTTDIAKEAGCNQSLINYYFRSKEKLFLSIFEKKAMIFITSLKKPMETELPFNEKLRMLCESHFRMLSKNARVPLFLLNEIGSKPERLSIIKGMVKESLAEISPSVEKELEREIRAGRIRETTLTEILLTMVSLNVGTFLFNPVLKTIIEQKSTDTEEQLKRRGEENSRIFLLSLQP